MRYQVLPIHHPFLTILDRESLMMDSENEDFALQWMRMCQAAEEKCGVLDTETGKVTINGKTWKEEDEP